jgi:hypothetical protein
MCSTQPGAIQFKLGDLRVSKIISELDTTNTLADWIRSPEPIDASEFGQVDHRIDIYHLGLLLLQFAYSQELRSSREEILNRRPREKEMLEAKNIEPIVL